MSMFLFCLLYFSAPQGQAQTVEAVQALVEHEYNGLKSGKVSTDIFDQDRNAFTLPCIGDPQCLDERIGHEIKLRYPQVQTNALEVFEVPEEDAKVTWPDMLHSGERRLPYKLNGQRMFSHQVLEIKVTTSSESYVYDPIGLNSQKLFQRHNWEKTFDARGRLFFKPTDIR